MIRISALLSAWFVLAPTASGAAQAQRLTCVAAGRNASDAEEAVCWFAKRTTFPAGCSHAGTDICLAQTLMWCSKAALDMPAASHSCFLANIAAGDLDGARTFIEYLQAPNDQVARCLDGLEQATRMRVVSDPPGAEILVGGEARGIAPVTVTLPPPFWRQRVTARFGKHDVSAGTDALIATLDRTECTVGQLLIAQDGRSDARPRADAGQGLELAPGAAALPATGAGPRVARLEPEAPIEEPAAPEGDFHRLYVSLSVALGMAFIDAGMKADRDPPTNLVFQTPIYGPMGDVLEYQRVEDPIATYRHNRAIDAQLAEEGLSSEDRARLRALKEELVLARVDDELGTPWVPDADSEDSWSRPSETGDGRGIHGGPCSADGTPTGPYDDLADNQGNGLFPSKYCVRVKPAGLGTTTALRLAMGYFVTESIGLGLVGRLQLSAGRGTLANLLFGPRMEVMLTDHRTEGFMAGVFFGGTVGQIQVQPHELPAGVDAPWIVSGPFGFHAGASLRFRFGPHVGLVLAPELDIQFPDLLANIDAPVGVEIAF